MATHNSAQAAVPRQSLEQGTRLGTQGGPATARRPRSLRPATDPLHLALMLLMVLTISRAHEQFPFLAVVRPALLLVGFALVQAVMNPRLLSEAGLLGTWPPKLIACFLGMACLSVPFGISPGNSGLFILQSYLSVIVFAGLLIVAVRRAADLYAFVWALVIGGGILAFFADYVFHLTAPDGGLARLNNMYTYDGNDAGLVLVVVIPMTLLTLQVSRWKGKLLSLVFLYWEWVAIARTGSRGAFIGILAVGLGLLLLPNGLAVWKRMVILGTAVSFLLIAAPPGYWKQMMTITDPTSDYNWTARDGRKQVAERGIGYMLGHPITGIGVGNFARAEGTISDKAKTAMVDPNTPGIKWSAPHNSHVEAGAELGIPGFVIWASMLIGGIAAPLRIRKRLPKSWQRGARDERFIYSATMYIPLSMCGFLVCCTFVSFAYMDPLYVLLAFVSGLYVCSDRLLRERRLRRQRFVNATNSSGLMAHAWAAADLRNSFANLT